IFSERVAITYKNSGIRVSVLCCDRFITTYQDGSIINQYDNNKLKDLVESVIEGIQKEEFMIHSRSNRVDFYPNGNYNDQMPYVLRA
ncbi:MAG: hypothetical protein ABUT20_45010, partial [Bacteroidota bacterium]